MNPSSTQSFKQILRKKPSEIATTSQKKLLIQQEKTTATATDTQTGYIGKPIQCSENPKQKKETQSKMTTEGPLVPSFLSDTLELEKIKDALDQVERPSSFSKISPLTDPADYFCKPFHSFIPEGFQMCFFASSASELLSLYHREKEVLRGMQLVIGVSNLERILRRALSVTHYSINLFESEIYFAKKVPGRFTELQSLPVRIHFVYSLSLRYSLIKLLLGQALEVLGAPLLLQFREKEAQLTPIDLNCDMLVEEIIGEGVQEESTLIKFEIKGKGGKRVQFKGMRLEEIGRMSEAEVEEKEREAIQEEKKEDKKGSFVKLSIVFDDSLHDKEQGGASRMVKELEDGLVGKAISRAKRVLTMERASVHFPELRLRDKE